MSRTNNKDIELGGYRSTSMVEEYDGYKPVNTFHFDVSFSVTIKDKKKMIVNHISDVIQSGEMLAIMGPSGAGKTSLLRVLTMEAHGGQSEGTITFNGLPMNSQLFKAKCGLVAQEDYHWAFLTCRETIAYACDLLSATVSTAAEKLEHVNRMISKMGLDSCADTLVGNAFMHGLSGGQKRRLSIAVALMKRLELIFLDEPTSGLDAAAASGIMSFLGELTKSERLITIFTVHQPSTNIYNSFDRVMLLSKGRVAYDGFKDHVPDYLASIGHPLPPMTNPAEFMLDIVNTDFTDDAQVEAILLNYDVLQRPVNDERIQRILDKNKVTIANNNNNALALTTASDNVSIFKQSAIMFDRHAKLAIRDPLLYIGRIVMFFFLCIFFAIIYVDARILDQSQATSHMWLAIWCIGVPTNAAVIAVYGANVEFFTIRKEVKNGMTSTIPYLLATSILQIPFMFLFGIFSISVAEYGIINYNRKHYGQMLLIYSLTMYSYEAIAQMFSVAFDNPLLGMMQYVNVWFSSFLFCGLFIEIQSIPWPFRIFSYILPFRYSVRSMAYQEYDGTLWGGAYPCDVNTDTNCLPGGYTCGGENDANGCYGQTGLQVLDSLHQEFPVFSAENHFGTDIGIIIAIAVVCKLFYMIMIMVKSRKESKLVPYSTTTTAK